METKPIRQRNQITISKGHIVAVSITTLSLSLFAGVVGFQSGRKFTDNFESNQNMSLLPDIEKQASLEALLLEIEKTDIKRSDKDFLFPDELKHENPLPLPSDPEFVVNTTGIAPSEENMVVELPEGPLPTSGWSIQVGSYPNKEEAMAQLDVWKSQGRNAYIVPASLGDELWYRLRISGFDNKAQAGDAKQILQEEHQEFDYIVVKSP